MKELEKKNKIEHLGKRGLDSVPTQLIIAAMGEQTKLIRSIISSGGEIPKKIKKAFKKQPIDLVNMVDEYATLLLLMDRDLMAFENDSFNFVFGWLQAPLYEIRTEFAKNISIMLSDINHERVHGNCFTLINVGPTGQFIKVEPYIHLSKGKGASNDS